MTDVHMRILRRVARQTQRELEAHDESENAGGTAAAGRRRHLERAATRTRARVAGAQAQRRGQRPERAF
jgi:hypothetical protein